MSVGVAVQRGHSSLHVLVQVRIYAALLSTITFTEMIKL